MTTGSIDQTRESFRQKAWQKAYDGLVAADQEAALSAEDLERLAIAAHMVGRDDASSAAWSRAHQENLRAGNHAGAVRCGFWHGFLLLLNGEQAKGNGWLARVQRMLDESGQDCVERGYLLVPPAVMALHRGDIDAARPLLEEGNAFAARFHDRQLNVMVLMGLGQIAVLQGERAEGLAMLDEVMVAVTEEQLSPILTGLAYCVSIDSCQLAFDLGRAQEWTDALGHWCATQAGLVPFRRECLVHRSEILQLHGAWAEALEEARRASNLLQGTGEPRGAGPAYYQEAELYRLRGEFDRAEKAYRLAARWGHNPQPGLALLRMSRGDIASAVAAIRLSVEEAHQPVERARVLPAYVEIMLAAADVTAARAGADELAGMAARLGAPLLHAASSQASGAVLLAEGSPRAALSDLRHAAAAWQELDAPYETARTRVMAGIACRQLGDADTADLEFDAARWAFERLGAAPGLARVDALSGTRGSRDPDLLTPREIEVLRLVAAGKTNQTIAEDLVLSEHTVRRHLQNIFTKLGVSSRAAATAFAFQNNLT